MSEHETVTITVNERESEEPTCNDMRRVAVDATVGVNFFHGPS